MGSQRIGPDWATFTFTWGKLGFTSWLTVSSINAVKYKRTVLIKWCGQLILDWKWKWKSLSHVRSLQPHGLYSPWNSPGQNTGVGSLSLFQGIFPTQGSNLGLLHCRQILYQLSYKGSPRIVDWVAYPSPADLAIRKAHSRLYFLHIRVSYILYMKSLFWLLLELLSVSGNINIWLKTISLTGSLCVCICATFILFDLRL